jgi:WD40 repeat protein
MQPMAPTTHRRSTRQIGVATAALLSCAVAGCSSAPPAPTHPSSPSTPEVAAPKVVGLPWPVPQLGRSEEVAAVAWSPDGTRIASGSRRGTISLWSAADGKLLATLEEGGQKGYVTEGGVAWSPDGKRIVSGAASRVVELWSAVNGKLLATLKGHTSVVNSVAWSPDGTRIASGSLDNTVKLWSAADGKLQAALEGHTSVVNSVAWSPDGTRIASGSRDKTVKLWSAADGRLLATWNGCEHEINSVAWSPDGTRIVTGDANGASKLWSAADGKLLARLEGHTSVVNSVAWSPDGTRIASGSRDKTVKLWSAADGKLLATLKGHKYEINSVAWRPDSARIASGSTDGTVKVWNAADGKLQATLKKPYVEARSVAWSPDGTRIASGSKDETIKLWSATDGELLATLKGHVSTVNSVAWSPDGTRIASGSESDNAKVWSATERKRLATLKWPAVRGVVGVAWSPDGTRIASWGSNALRLWSTADGEFQGSLEEREADVTSAAWSPDGARIASGSTDETIKLWSAHDGKLLATLTGHESVVADVAWSPDGTRIASGSEDETVKLWSATDGTLLATLEGYEGDIASVAWSPDGAWIASGSSNGTVELWSAADGTLLATLGERTNLDSKVAWSPDSRAIAATSPSGVSIYRLSDHKRVALTSYGDRWLAYADNGLFAGDGDAGEIVMFRVGDDITSTNNLLTAGQLPESFHRPSLVADFLAGKPIDLPEDAKNGIGLPPRVSSIGAPPREESSRTPEVRARKDEDAKRWAVDEPFIRGHKYDGDLPELKALVKKCESAFFNGPRDNGWFLERGLTGEDKREILERVVEAISRSPRFIAQVVYLGENEPDKDIDVDSNLYPNVCHYRHQGSLAVSLAICRYDVECESARRSCWFTNEKLRDLGGVDTPVGEVRLQQWGGTPIEGFRGIPAECEPRSLGDFAVVTPVFEHRPVNGVKRLLLEISARECCWSKKGALATPADCPDECPGCSFGYGGAPSEDVIAVEKRNGVWRLLAAVDWWADDICHCAITGDWAPCAAASVLQ